MDKKRVWLFIVFLLVALNPAVVTEGAGQIDYYPHAILALSTTLVPFGALQTEPFDPPLEYFETEDALSIHLITLRRDWQLVMSGGDFRSGTDTIPLEQLEWKKQGSVYKKMKAAGSEEVIAKGRDYRWPVYYIFDLSFRLVLTGGEVPGYYGNTMIFSFVFP